MAARDDDRHDDCVPYEEYEELLDELELYRQAAEDTLQLLDWSIGYLYGIRRGREAHALSRGRQRIRTSLLGREEQVTPTDQAGGAEGSAA